jgi:hypothetical protein
LRAQRNPLLLAGGNPLHTLRFNENLLLGVCEGFEKRSFPTTIARTTYGKKVRFSDFTIAMKRTFGETLGGKGARVIKSMD